MLSSSGSSKILSLFTIASSKGSYSSGNSFCPWFANVKAPLAKSSSTSSLISSINILFSTANYLFAIWIMSAFFFHEIVTYDYLKLPENFLNNILSFIKIIFLNRLSKVHLWHFNKIFLYKNHFVLIGILVDFELSPVKILH